jgi:hypothetical protein
MLVAWCGLHANKNVPHNGERFLERLKSYFTVRVALTRFVSVPLVELIVREKVPRADSFVPIESFVLPVVVTVDGENEAVAPDGRPATAKLTRPVKPLSGDTDTVYAAVAPLETVFDDGEMLIAKLAGATYVNADANVEVPPSGLLTVTLTAPAE